MTPPATAPNALPKPGAQDELKTLPMPELEKRLGSSARGLTQYGSNEIEAKKANPLVTGDALAIAKETARKAGPPSEVAPQLVKRVHELYEKLGQEDVRAVENWDRAKTADERLAK